MSGIRLRLKNSGSGEEFLSGGDDEIYYWAQARFIVRYEQEELAACLPYPIFSAVSFGPGAGRQFLLLSPLASPEDEHFISR